MYNENKQMFLLDGENLEELLRKIIKEEISQMVKSITRVPKTLTRDEAAELLNVCPNTISEFIKGGRLINRGVGRKILLHDIDLDGIRARNVKHNKHW